MSWKKIKPNMSMSQTMLLDNQSSYSHNEIIGSLKRQIFFFDKILVNRAYILNNYEMIKILKNRDKNGFLNVLQSGSLAFIMEGKLPNISITKSLEKAQKDNMAGLVADKCFTESLDEDIEKLGSSIPYVTFDYSETTKNYLSLIKKYYEMLKSDEDSLIGNISGHDKEKLKDLRNLKNTDITDITRTKLYSNEWFDIPLRPSPDTINYDTYKSNLREKKSIKQILDVAYNVNIPNQHKLNFEYPKGIKPLIFGEKKGLKHTPHNIENSKFPEIKLLKFEDIIEIITEESLMNVRKVYLDSLKKLKKSYNEDSIREFIDCLNEYLKKIYEKFNKNKQWYDVNLSCLIIPYSNNECTIEVDILTIDNDEWKQFSLFQMLLNKGITEQKVKIPKQKLFLKNGIYDSGLF